MLIRLYNIAAWEAKATLLEPKFAMITFMTHWSRETSLLIEGPPFFKIAAAIIDHAANKDMGLIHIYILMD